MEAAFEGISFRLGTAIAFTRRFQEADDARNLDVQPVMRGMITGDGAVF